MKKTFENKYIAWGITLFSVFSALILLFFAIYRWDYIFSFIKTIITILMPFIYGLAIAYLMNPIVKFFENKVFNKLVNKISFSKIDNKKLCRILSLFTSTIIFLGLIIGSISFLIPEMLKSLEMLVLNINTYLSNSKELLIKMFGGSDAITEFINENYDEFTDVLNKAFNQGVFNDMMVTISSSIFGTIKFLYNLIVGYIIAIYVLIDKEKYKAQSKKILYTLFDYDRINIILENARYTDRIFGGFFAGKLVDSLIVGIICFICMIILQMPYALIVSVIIGVTNIIPYFGPFIGAIPSVFLIFLVDPGKSLLFIVFIFILQQIDGNIIGPKILGNKTGLSSFWVLFSLLIFGGLFGMVGMILGVPLFSILYSFINGLLKRRLKAKNLPEDSKDYEKLLYIDEKTGKLVYDK